MLLWLNDVLAAAVSLKRDISPVVATCPLVSGSVQNLPAATGQYGSYVQCMEPLYNTASLNAVNKAGMTLIQRRIPNWRTITQTTDVTDVMFDDRSPTVFHVYPPNNGSGSLQMLVGGVPFMSGAGVATLNTSTTVIPIPDNYRQAIVHGLISKALASQTRRQDTQKAQFHWQIFEGMILASKIAIPEATPRLSEKEQA